MLCFKSRLLNVIFGLTAIACSSYLHAGVSIIVSAPPPAREIVVGPPGYTTCYVVPGGFYNGVWLHKHRVCEYEGNAGMRIWVNGFWQCGSYRAGGICTAWHWVGSHWANRSDMAFYRRATTRNYHGHNGGTQVHGHEVNRGYRNHHEHGHEYRKGTGNVHGNSYNQGNTNANDHGYAQANEHGRGYGHENRHGHH